MYVVGVDPGVSTGVAWLHVIESEVVNHGSYTIAMPRSPVLQAAAVRAWWNKWAKARARTKTDPVYLGIEEFVLRNVVSTSPDVLSPVIVGTVVELTLHPHVVAVQRLSAATCKGSVPDDRLKRWGYWVPGADHERDAYRVALTALRRI